MQTKDLEERLRSLEERLERAERLSYLTYCEVRKVAEYAYTNVLLEETPETVKRLPGMKAIQAKEAYAVGIGVHELVALQRHFRVFVAQCRRDALEIGKIAARSLALREQSEKLAESKRAA